MDKEDREICLKVQHFLSKQVREQAFFLQEQNRIPECFKDHLKKTLQYAKIKKFKINIFKHKGTKIHHKIF